jgi:hypothetical protein
MGPYKVFNLPGNPNIGTEGENRAFYNLSKLLRHEVHDELTKFDAFWDTRNDQITFETERGYIHFMLVWS